MHLDPSDPVSLKRLRILMKPEIAVTAILRIEKSLYLHNRLTDFDEISHGDVILSHLGRIGQYNFEIIKFQDSWRPTFENENRHFTFKFAENVE